MRSLHPITVGASYRTAPAGLRDSMYMDVEARRAAYRTLRDQGIEQALILSTCDRVEITAMSSAPERDAQALQSLLAKRAETTASKIADQAYRHYDDEAVHHVFSVACALDSHMIGEAQVFGQFREAANEAQEAGAVGAELNALLQAAYQTAKRVRTQTRIGEGAVSVASAAIRIARDLHEDLTACRALLFGLGETGMVLMEQFRQAGLDHWMLTGTSRRTERVARRLDCHYIPVDDLPDALAKADIVIAAAGTGRYLIADSLVDRALKARKRRPVLLIDAAVPADIDPSVDDLDDAFLYALEDIERLAERGQNDRQDAAEQARAMVQEAVGDHRRAQAEKDGVPALVALRQQFDQVRQSVLRDHPNADAQEATRLLVNRLLHRPSEALRRVAGEGDAADLRDTITVNRVLEQLFGISATDTNETDGSPHDEGEEE